MPDRAASTFGYDDFSCVVEKKAFHDFLLIRGTMSKERRARKNLRAAFLTAARWLGVVTGGSRSARA